MFDKGPIFPLFVGWLVELAAATCCALRELPWGIHRVAGVCDRAWVLDVFR